MCDPIIGGTALAALGSSAALPLAVAGLSIYQGEKARRDTKRAAEQAATRADQAYNKANPKKPNAQGMEDANTMAAAAGPGSTMLTGALGVDPNDLTLGRKTLLGAAGG